MLKGSASFHMDYAISSVYLRRADETLACESRRNETQEARNSCPRLLVAQAFFYFFILFLKANAKLPVYLLLHMLY